MRAHRKPLIVTAALVIGATVTVGASWQPAGSDAGVPVASSAPRSALTDATRDSATDASSPDSTGATGRVRPDASAAGSGIATLAQRSEPGWLQPSGDTTRLVLVGDSLAQESAGLIGFLTAPKQLVPKFWGGTAPCDWVDKDLEADSSTVVVIQFTGNSLTPCMSDGAGGFLEHEAFAVAYEQALHTLIERARQAGARVVLVGQPYRAERFEHEDRVDAINAMLRGFADRWAFVSFVDAGAAVETPEGRFAERLPCTGFDIDCAADGTTVVRGDGVHFCPSHLNVSPCPVHSSGALRFSLAIAAAANDPVAYD
ncbi:MAG: hypothetical protein Q8M22_04805 [Actinomycetota bacterium]|nr:hypothetical protein [Actinomycetota bacterium]